MSTFQRISCQQAHQLLANQACQIVDIRDAMSYRMGHASGAEALDNSTLPDFLARADRSLPTLVFCYHGNSSQGAAQFLAEQQFSEVYSVDGGFEAWRSQFPHLIAQGDR